MRGAILADIRINQAAGNFVLMRKHSTLVEDGFDEGQSWFMPMRHRTARVAQRCSKALNASAALPVQPPVWVGPGTFAPPGANVSRATGDVTIDL